MMSKLSSLKCFSVDEYNEDKIANNERMDGTAGYTNLKYIVGCQHVHEVRFTLVMKLNV